MREAELVRLFDRFNAQYFGGQLPRFLVKYVQQVPGVDSSVSGRVDFDSRTIWLRRSEDPREVSSALLHEMAHVKVGPEHGRSFFDELMRLALAGVLLVGDDDVSDMEYEQFFMQEELKAAARQMIDEENTDQKMGGSYGR